MNKNLIEVFTDADGPDSEILAVKVRAYAGSLYLYIHYGDGQKSIKEISGYKNNALIKNLGSNNSIAQRSTTAYCQLYLPHLVNSVKSPNETYLEEIGEWDDLGKKFTLYVEFRSNHQAQGLYVVSNHGENSTIARIDLKQADDSLGKLTYQFGPLSVFVDFDEGVLNIKTLGARIFASLLATTMRLNEGVEY